jgi:uncharacterized repeat protein (TIGR03803 family)
MGFGAADWESGLTAIGTGAYSGREQLPGVHSQPRIRVGSIMGASNNYRQIVITCMALCLFGLAAARGGWAQTFTALYVFKSAASGATPSGSLAMDDQGVLYGATQLGGANTQCSAGFGCGTVYSLTPPSAPGSAWTETVLWNFGGTQTDGYNPLYGVVRGAEGVLYGTTDLGGTGCGCGAVFSLTPPATHGAGWTETLIWSFVGGAVQPSGLVIGSGGVLYGTTRGGGANGFGTVFSLTPPTSPGGAWTEADLWTFNTREQGFAPNPGVVIGQDGTLYGSTSAGGEPNGLAHGIIFSVTPPAVPGGQWSEATIYTESHSTPGQIISVGLGADGVLYGTTGFLHRKSKGGTVFSLTPPASQHQSWTREPVWTFPAASNESQIADIPDGPLVFQKRTGGIFGTSSNGHGLGAVYKLLAPTSPGSAWRHRVLANGVFITVGLYHGAVLYGTEASETGAVWSLVP